MGKPYSPVWSPWDNVILKCYSNGANWDLGDAFSQIVELRHCMPEWEPPTDLFAQRFQVSIVWKYSIFNFLWLTTWARLSQKYHDLIKWKHFPRYWPFVRGIHRCIPLTIKASDAELWPFIMLCIWTNGWTNNREAGDLRRHQAHNVVTVMRHWDVSPRSVWF